jgi:ATP-dependent RNA helicase DeaD
VAFPPTALPLARALIEREYNDPTPVQTAVMEPEADGRDLLVSAQTGSGKTVAYGIAMGSTLLGEAEFLGRAGDPVALIIAPTRELALQVHRELTWLYQYAEARVVSCVGGMDPKSEARKLNEGAHIVVGTPGRLRDHLERGRLKIANLKAVVLDEADEMLDLGFREDLEFILEATPADRRTLLFSATLPKEIVSLAKKYQRDAWRIQAGGNERGHADIEYRAIAVAPREIEHVVVNVLRFVEAPSAIVFCNTRESVRHLQAILSERGFSAVSLSGELSQSERNHALQALRDGRARVCVATDVAARGIDLPNLGLVIHADLPHDPEVLQHRSGRTGRAGRKGVSVLLVPQSRRRKADIILRHARIEPSWAPAPSADEIRKLDQERLLQSPLLNDEQTEDDLVMAKALLAERSAEDIASALVRIYRSGLPAPEDILDPGTYRESRDKSDGREPRSRREREPRDPQRESAPRPKKTGPALAGGSIWFRMNVGREKNADPRWLLPMICRQGGITKREIGAIKIFEHETRVEIAGEFSESFLANVRQIPKGEVRIEPMKPGAELSEPVSTPDADIVDREPNQRPRPNKYDKSKQRAKSNWEPREQQPRFTPEPDSHPDASREEAAPVHKPKEWAKPNHDGKKKYEGKTKYEGKPKFEGKPKHEGKPKFEKRDEARKPDAPRAPSKPDRGDVRNPSERLSFSDRPKPAGKPEYKGKPKPKYAGKPGGKPGGKPNYSKQKPNKPRA